MELSVIIPAFNNPEYVKITLLSLKAQKTSLSEWEILLIDDSYEFCMNEFAKWDFPQLRVINKEHGGRADARNFGIKNAKGKIIVFIDSDIIVEKDFIQRHYNHHKSNIERVVLGDVRHIEADNFKKVKEIVAVDSWDIAQLFKYVKKDAYINLSELVFINSSIAYEIGWICCLFSNCSVPKVAFESSGIFDKEFTGWGLEDIELGYRFKKKGIKFLYDKNLINYHLDHIADGNSMLSDMSSNIKLFYKKHPEDAIRAYMSFVAGFASLEELAKNILGECITFPEGKKIYFKPIQYAKTKSIVKD